MLAVFTVLGITLVIMLILTINEYLSSYITMPIMFLCVVAFAVLPSFGRVYPDSGVVYEAVVTGLREESKEDIIRFSSFTQSSGTIEIKGYSTSTLHWLDFNKYDYHDKILTIRVPNGVFEYKPIAGGESTKAEVIRIREE